MYEFESGEKEGHVVPASVNTKQRFYGYYKKTMLERIEDQADKASNADDHARFTLIMSHVLSMMDIVDEDIAGRLHGLVPKPRQRLIPAYKKYARKSSKGKSRQNQTTKAAEKNTGTSAFFIDFLWELFNVADEADGAHAAILT